LARKMPLTLTNVALDVSKVIEKQRPFHAPQYPFSRGGGKRRVARAPDQRKKKPLWA
jgi:hypothetical protein